MNCGLKTFDLATNQEIYQKECLSKILIPFFQNTLTITITRFGLTKYYTKKIISFLESKNIKLVPKNHNLTNLPQFRPVEDSFGELSSQVYNKGRKDSSIKQLTSKNVWKEWTQPVYNKLAQWSAHTYALLSTKGLTLKTTKIYRLVN